MKEFNEKMDSKKEYSAPQMEVLDGAVQSFLCSSGDVIVVGDDDND
jgi:hypothetical protein